MAELTWIGHLDTLNSAPVATLSSHANRFWTSVGGSVTGEKSQGEDSSLSNPLLYPLMHQKQ